MPAGGLFGLGSAATGGLLGGLGSLGSGLLGYFGANRAANQQADALRQAYLLQKPFADAGTGALAQLQRFMSNPSGANNPFQPMADFLTGQAKNAALNTNASLGQLFSSNMGQQLSKLGAGYAQQYGVQPYVNSLLDTARIGAGAVGGAAGSLAGAGAASAGGTVGGLNALGAGLSGAANNFALPYMLAGLNRGAYGGGGSSYYQPGTAANGGWSTQVFPS